MRFFLTFTYMYIMYSNQPTFEGEDLGLGIWNPFSLAVALHLKKSKEDKGPSFEYTRSGREQSVKFLFPTNSLLRVMRKVWKFGQVKRGI